ncbi:MAG TPA: multiheme c-type cytochrome [Bryobacteraceae bacterium]|nr:multiheme c-type cytochrome [Bryobacteraceae bacterium]
MASLLAAGTPESNGAASCATCHRAQALTQPSTSMSHALEMVAACDILRDNPKLVFHEGPYSYQILREGDKSIYSVTDGKETMRVPIGWALGLGSAGQTYVYEWNGNLYESRVSYYKKVQGLDLTMGAQNMVPAGIEEAAGRRIGGKEVAECFGCHATNAVHDNRPTLDQLTPGVQCERCHGDATRHVAAVRAGDVKGAAMKRLGALSTEELSDFCGQCHRTWANIASSGPRNVNNVRFQPYRLTNSRCYDATDRRISCVACHDPHREVVRETSAYDAKCLACHSAGPAAGAHAAAAGSDGRRTAVVCPKASANCVSCHMPRYEIPGSHNLFTDHQIRIVKPGEPYPG